MKMEIITIDGPSGSGKSTLSRLIARRLGFTYLDTGAMYRAVGYKARQKGVSFTDDQGLAEILEDMNLELTAGNGDTRVIMDNEDISQAIRTADMGMAASAVSARPIVREKLTILQQEMGRKGKVVAEGRDTGTVVFPEARYKFYLDASPEERARRRYSQLLEQGQNADLDEILAQIIQRDQNDSSRSLAPLKAAADAVIIDSSALSIEEVALVILKRMVP